MLFHRRRHSSGSVPTVPRNTFDGFWRVWGFPQQVNGETPTGEMTTEGFPWSRPTRTGSGDRVGFRPLRPPEW